jgi:uncharacterized protein
MTDAPAADARDAALLGAGPAGEVVHDEVVDARAPWSHVVRAGQSLRIVDVGGNQAVDCVLFVADEPSERYSAPDTIAAQGNAFLTVGSVLRSTEGRSMMTITGSTVERHDTIGGACSKESNALRYGRHTAGQHACAENFLLEGSRHGLTARDLVSNVNWYMNVPVDPDGALGIVDGISAAGLSLRLRAERDVLVIVSNCPQVNNPCNGFNPTPVRMVVTAPSGAVPATTASTDASTTGPEA